MAGDVVHAFESTDGRQNAGAPNETTDGRQDAGAPIPSRRRLLLPALMVLLYWGAILVTTVIAFPAFIRFMTQLIGCALLLLVFSIWWLCHRRDKFIQRFWLFSAGVLAVVVAMQLRDPSFVWLPLLLSGLPYVFTAWIVYLFATWRAPTRVRFGATLAALVLTWIPFMLMRMEGLTGDVGAIIRWRWSKTAEELFLEDHAAKARQAPSANSTPATVAKVVIEGTKDWPGFRGAERDGVVRGATISTNFSAAPEPVWKQLAGASWSSMAVVDGQLYTQEQRGTEEVVVCLDAATGKELWVHQDKVRYWDGQSGAGPRASCSVHKGFVYAVGGSGLLNCLNAGTGAVKWSRNIATDSGAAVPVWGFCSSPLIVGDLAIVYAGGKEKKGLLAYRLDNGEIAWTAEAGSTGYGSPQLATVHGEKQVLIFADHGVSAFEPATGKLVWEHLKKQPGAPRSIQPHVIDGKSVLISSEMDIGTARVEITCDGATWKAATNWQSGGMKTSFNDFVVHNGSIYGFDGGVLCCVNLETGERRWKDGKYGHGQLILLEDQSLLIVLSEQGEVAIVEAKPEKRTELLRFQAINGKTWNHPAFANGRLYVRNAEEIACYLLGVK